MSQDHLLLSHYKNFLSYFSLRLSNPPMFTFPYPTYHTQHTYTPDEIKFAPWIAKLISSQILSPDTQSHQPMQNQTTPVLVFLSCPLNLCIHDISAGWIDLRSPHPPHTVQPQILFPDDGYRGSATPLWVTFGLVKLYTRKSSLVPLYKRLFDTLLCRAYNVFGFFFFAVLRFNTAVGWGCPTNGWDMQALFRGYSI